VLAKIHRVHISFQFVARDVYLKDLVLHLKIYLLCTAPFWFFLAQQKDLFFPEIKHIFLKMANYATYTCFFAVSFLLVGFCEFLIFIINVQKFVWVMVLFSNHVSFFYPTGLLTVS
jgi:hypothetical protein